MADKDPLVHGRKVSLDVLKRITKKLKSGTVKSIDGYYYATVTKEWLLRAGRKTLDDIAKRK